MMDSYSTRPLSPNVDWNAEPREDLPDEPEPDHLSDAE